MKVFTCGMRTLVSFACYNNYRQDDDGQDSGATCRSTDNQNIPPGGALWFPV